MSWNNDNSFVRAIQSQIIAKRLAEECKRNGCKNVEELINKKNEKIENCFQKFAEDNNSGRAFFIKDNDVVCSADVSNVKCEPTKVSDVMQEIGNKFSMSFEIEDSSAVDLFQKTLEEDSITSYYEHIKYQTDVTLEEFKELIYKISSISGKSVSSIIEFLDRQTRDRTVLQEFKEFPIIKISEDLKSDDILIKQKYSQPLYRERLHPKDVVVFRNKCRIRNRPNSGHKFK